MIEVICNDRLGKKIRVKCKCVMAGVAASRWGAPGGCRKQAGRIARSSLGSWSFLPPASLPSCSPDDTVGDLKKLIAAQTGALTLQTWARFPEAGRGWRESAANSPHRRLSRTTPPPSPLPPPPSPLPPGTRPERIRLQKWYTIFKDHITLEDYEIHDGMGLELYYN